MARNQAVIEFLLQWSEKGGNLPDKVKRDLDRMGRSGHDASSVTDRLGLAFERLEKREPTFAVRRIRMAVEDLSTTAIGATGPLGRLAASFASLIPGGTWTLATIGGVAGLVVEFKKLIGQGDAIEATLLKANQGFAAMAGGAAAALSNLSALNFKAEQLSSPRFIESDPLGISDVSFAARIQRLAEQATIENEIALQVRQIHKTHEQIIAQHTRQVQLLLEQTDAYKAQQAAQRESLRMQEASNDLLAEFAVMQRNIARDNPFLVFGFPDVPIGIPKEIPFAGLERAKEQAGLGFFKDMEKNAGALELALDGSADAARRAAEAHQRAAIAIINAVAGLVAGLVSGGSAGGFFAGLGGLIGLFNPLAGAVVGGIGSILLANESNDERRHGELLRALEPIGDLTFLVTSGTFTDAASLDSFVRRAEQATNRRVTVRYGGR